MSYLNAEKFTDLPHIFTTQDIQLLANFYEIDIEQVRYIKNKLLDYIEKHFFPIKRSIRLMVKGIPCLKVKAYYIEIQDEGAIFSHRNQTSYSNKT